MRILNDEEMFSLIASKEQLELLKKFPGTAKMSPEYHTIAKAQYQLDLRDIVELLSKVADKGVPSPHKRAVELLESLKQLVEEK